MIHKRFVIGLFTAAFLGAALGPAQAAAPPNYKITKTVPLGAPDRWDYVIFEPVMHRLYVAHYNEITVVDSRSGELVGRVQGIADVSSPLSDVDGVAIVPALGKGYTASRAKKAAVVFDLKTLKVLKDIPADTHTDSLVYEPRTRRVMVINNDAKDVTIIDAKTDTAITNLPLGGRPENLVSDDAGHVFISLSDTKEVVRVDARTARIEARWPIAACDGVHGMAMDRKGHRLFASCSNAKMVILDSSNGAVLAELPIGKFTDAAEFDAKRRLAFSSNGEGTLSVIKEQSPGTFVSLGEITTRPMARTMAVDPETGRIFMVAPEVDEVDPKADALAQRYKVRPGSVQLLFLDPS